MLFLSTVIFVVLYGILIGFVIYLTVRHARDKHANKRESMVETNSKATSEWKLIDQLITTINKNRHRGENDSSIILLDDVGLTGNKIHD